MKTMMVRVAIAIGFAVGAWFSWTEAETAGRRADAAQQIVTLHYADVDADADAVTSATVAYWLGQYGNVAPDTGNAVADAAVLRTAANAAFRESQRDVAGTGDRPASGRGATSGEVTPERLRREGGEAGAVIQRLDGVLQAYASALKASARDVEAAYNYEYVARLRDQVARSQGKVKLTPAPVAARAGDLPAGPTIHGKPGGPPPEAKMEDLEMLSPLEYGDREAQPEATPGAKRERKG
jgi:hypothetical protein